MRALTPWKGMDVLKNEMDSVRPILRAALGRIRGRERGRPRSISLRPRTLSS